MAILKLSLCDFDAIDYDLIAIHTSLEDYRLAYFLNQKLSILLRKSNDLLEFSTDNGSAFFSKFVYHIEDTQEQWNLIENRDDLIDASDNKTADLFSQTNDQKITNVYFIPDLKKVNYFLKIENTFLNIKEIISALNTIPQISAAYRVNLENIKSKNNLIF